MISKIIANIFDQPKDNAEKSVQVVAVIERFFSQEKNRELVDHLITQIFDFYEPDVKLLAQGVPDRIVEALFS